MSDQQSQPPGTPEPLDRDPWAPPQQGGAPQHGDTPQNTPWPGGSGTTRPDVPLETPGAAPAAPYVHQQPTVTSMPGAGTGAVPPPPTAPGGWSQPQPGAVPFGHTTAPLPPYGGGYPAHPGYQGYPPSGWQPPVAPSNGMGVASLVLGILAVTFFCLWGVPGVLFGGLALIFGIIGRRRHRRGEADNGGVALAGIILGSIGLALGTAFLALTVWGLSMDADSSVEDPWYGAGGGLSTTW
ncbi:DUF4190 domain-containing protein [Streptomyces sp. NPDC001985]|uniref:DUF4190 domain-containing protein n=1 Tax=Streptomyces sp. NPDC001985 TaxID=3154406 RepID=UPI00332D165C